MVQFLSGFCDDMKVSLEIFSPLIGTCNKQTQVLHMHWNDTGAAVKNGQEWTFTLSNIWTNVKSSYACMQWWLRRICGATLGLSYIIVKV